MKFAQAVLFIALTSTFSVANAKATAGDVPATGSVTCPHQLAGSITSKPREEVKQEVVADLGQAKGTPTQQQPATGKATTTN